MQAHSLAGAVVSCRSRTRLCRAAGALLAARGLSRPALSRAYDPPDEDPLGQLRRSGRILLNLRLIQAPLDLIEHVIVHELCRLKEHNHGKRYYLLLDTTMPDWRERRQRLNAFEFG